MSSDEIVPDSTSHQAILSALIPQASSDSLLAQSSPTPTARYHPRASMESRPEPRWKTNATYGRKKDATAVVDQDVMDTGDAFPPSPTTAFDTSFKTVDEADGARDETDTEDEGNGSPSGKPYVFSWKKQLEDLDKAWDEDDKLDDAHPDVVKASVPEPTETSSSTAPPSPTAALPPASRHLFATSSLTTIPSEESSQPPVPAASSKFKSRRSITTYESSTEKDDSDADAPSHRPRKKRALAINSDEESNDGDPPTSPVKSQRSDSSPAADNNLRLFDSPAKRASSPPTSPPDEDEQGAAPEESKKASRRKSTTKDKGLKLNKKQAVETDKETARLLAERRIVLPEQQQPRKSLQGLFSKIQSSLNPGRKSEPAPSHPESDPIITSSQAPPQPTAVSSTVSPDTSFSSPDQAPFITRPKVSLKGKEKAVSSEADDIVLDDADELPTLAEVDKELVAKRLKAEKEKQYRELQERKKRLVAEQEAAARKAALAKKQVAAKATEEDDDDELEIDVALGSQSLAIEEDVPGRLKTTQATRRAVLRGIVSPRKSVGKTNTPAKLFRHARLSAASDSQVKSAGKADVFHVHVSTPQKASTKKGAPKIDQDTLNAHLFQKAAEGAAKARKERDEEWTLRGGRSLRLEQLAMVEKPGGENVAAKLQEAIERVQNAEAEEYYDDEEDGEDQEYQPEDEGPGTAISESEKENNPPGLKRRSRSRSPSSDDDEDKENQSIQDKENVPPPAASSSQRHQITSDDDEENFAPPPGQSSPRRDDAEFIPMPRRRALKMIVMDEEDRENLGEGATPPPQDENQPPPPPGLQFDGDSDDEGPPRPGGLLFGGAGGKALLFNSSQESLGLGEKEVDAEIEGDGFTQLFQLSAKPAGFDALRRRGGDDDMDLESQKLLPAMDLSTQEMMRDDKIFEEDQLARAAIEREERQKAMAPKMYLNEDGFFTQTKPATQLPPVLDFPSPTQVFRAGSSSPTGSPTQFAVPPTQLSPQPLQRLRKGRIDTSSPTRVRPSNAFDLLMARKPTKPKMDKEAAKQLRDAFLEGEAAESDEDVMFGFGGGSKEDDREDDEDNDKHVEGLVDDAALDVNVDAIMQKVQEQAAEDDAKREQIAQKVAKGEMRGRKRDRGVGGLSDSDSDPDDEENRKMRRRMHKKRNVAYDKLEDLEKNPKAEAFLKVYQAGIAPDEDDLDMDPRFSSAGDVEVEDDGDDEDEGDDEEMPEEKEKEDEPLTITSVNRQLKELIEKGPDEIDVDEDEKMQNWWKTNLENDDEEEDVDDCQEVPANRKAASASRRKFGRLDGDEEARKEKVRVTNFGDMKAKSTMDREKKGNGFGTNKAGSAITGHSKPKPSTSSSSKTASSSASKNSRQPLGKSSSSLGMVMRKKTGFAE